MQLLYNVMQFLKSFPKSLKVQTSKKQIWKSPFVPSYDRPWMTVQLKSLIARRQKALASSNESLSELLRNKVNRERKRCCKVYY